MTLRRRLPVLLIAALLGTSSVVVVAAPAGAAKSGWDSRIQPIAVEVAKLRGLDFKQPVPVKFLSEAAFQKKVSVDDKLSKKDRADLARSESEFRAIGLIAGGVDLLDAVDSLQTSGVLAFYSPKTKSVTVRGTDIDVAMRVTLAHELTHALQDQYFDLDHLQSEAGRTHSEGALQALVEGDAVRVQQLYEAQLSAADQTAYAQSESAKSSAATDQIRAEGVPDSITTLFQAPYVLGPIMVDLVESQKKDGIDKLFLVPPTTDSSFLTPSTLLDDAESVKVPTPKVAGNEKVVGKPDVFGSFALYLMLAGQGDAGSALAVADGWGGDSTITFTRGGTTCMRTAFAGRSSDATTALAGALGAWTASRPTGTASSTRAGSVVTLTACDPGAGATDPPHSSTGALVVADVRNAVLNQAVGKGFPIAVGDCIAIGLVRDPVIQPFVAQAEKDQTVAPSAADTTALQQKVADLTTSCLKR